MNFRTCAEMNTAQFVTTKLGNAALRFRGRDRKTTFGENGKQSASFSRNSSVLHPCFLLFLRKSFDGQDRNFSQISSCESTKRSPHRLRRFR